MRRYILHSWLFLALLLLLAVPAVVQAQFTFTTNADNTITIAKYTGPGGDVTIPDTTNGMPVTTIGTSAFYECYGLTNVTIPGSIVSIGGSAFYWCSGLTGISIPKSVTNIGNQAFGECSGLTNVAIPNSVISIGSSAFIECGNLTNVTIPASVTGIGNLAFAYCSSLITITVDPQNPAYVSVDGVLFNEYQTTLMQYPARKAETAYTIPDSVTNLSDYAFESCGNLTNVAIPGSVTSIGTAVFSACSSLTAIDVNVTNSVYCSVDGALLDKAETMLIQCPGGITGGYAIPNSVLNIGNMAFQNCVRLTNVTIPNGVTNISGAAFMNCTALTSVTIPGSVMSIGGQAFYACSGLTNLTLFNGVAIITAYAFENCTGLTTFTIPGSVTSIGSSAFANCTHISKVFFQGNAPGADTTVFSGDRSSTVYYILGTTGWGTTFGGCAALGWDPTVPYLCTTNHITGVITITGYIWGYTNSGPPVVLSIPAEVHGLPVTTIGSDAFESCPGLASVTIPNGVTSILDYAFASCPSLTNVTIGNSVASIGNYVFRNCSSLTSLTIGTGLTKIGSAAFEYCSNLKTLFFEGNAPTVAVNAFTGVPSATFYYLPGTTGWSTFAANTGLTPVLWNPQVQTSGATFGVLTNGFGFTITGSSNLVIVVEASTNLSNPVWGPLATNTLSGGSAYFSDPQWTNYPGRFYRLRSP